MARTEESLRSGPDVPSEMVGRFLGWPSDGPLKYACVAASDVGQAVPHFVEVRRFTASNSEDVEQEFDSFLTEEFDEN